MTAKEGQGCAGVAVPRCRRGIRGWRRGVLWMLACLASAWACATQAFEIRFEGPGCPLPTNEVQIVWAELGRLIKAHQTLFHRSLPADFKITYHISRTRAEYAARAKLAGQSDASMAGYTRSQQRWQQTPEFKLLSAESVVEVWREQRTNDFMAVVLHESAHAVTAGFVGAGPLWFKEGSAELLGTPAAGRFKMRRQEEGQRWGLLARWLDQQKLPSLERLLDAGSYAAWDELGGGDRTVAYTMSYSLFYFLCVQPAAMTLVTTWLDTNHPEEGDALDRAFTDYLNGHWPGGLPAFERSWHALIRAQAAGAGPAVPAGSGNTPKPGGSGRP
ncbi:MAG: hypothetical protein ABSC03_00430 [Verrucomicrobiota bacterium]